MTKRYCSYCEPPAPNRAATPSAISDGATPAFTSASNLTARQLKVLGLASDHGRLLAKWNDEDLTALERAKFVSREWLTSPSGKTASLRLWVITDAGRLFTASEGLRDA
jgi:hypothetical protein